VRVLLVLATAPRTVQEFPLDLPEGATVSQALAAARASGTPSWPDALLPSIWGRPVRGRQPATAQDARLDTVLRDGDRLELLRPLRVDPKVARRERFGQQGSRGAGLFARRRPGAKPGY